MSWEVGQECLKAQERLKGGLLGDNHSWVADFNERSISQGVQHQQMETTNGNTTKSKPSLRRLLDNLSDWAYNCREKTADILSVDVRVQASRSHVLLGVTAATLTALFIQLLIIK